MSDKIKFKTWSATRLGDYKQCPRMAKLKHLDKLCTVCFKGRLRGGYGEPVICDACGAEIEMPAPMARGSRIGDALDLYLLGKADAPPAEIRHPLVLATIDECRDEVKAKKGKVQFDVVLSTDWKLVKGWDPAAWLWAKLDYLRMKGAEEIEVIDWKTGGIDKRNGSVRADAKYDDQLALYAIAALCAMPTVKRTSASLVFLDCGPRFDPTVRRECGTLDRKDLPAAKKGWMKKIKALLNDTKFAPSPGDKCRWCDFRKEVGGPCEF